MQLIDPKEELEMVIPGVVLIKPEERFSAIIGTATMHFRRYTSSQMIAVEARHPINEATGQPPNRMVTELLMECLWDWEGVVDRNKHPVPYTKELAQFISDQYRVQLIPKLTMSNPTDFTHITDSRIYYRRILPHEDDRIIAANTERGLKRDRAMIADQLKYAILGWDDVYNTEGELVPWQDDK